MSSDFYDELYKKPEFKLKETPPAATASVTDITELAKSELPALVAQAIALGKQSDRLNEVLALINTLADRAYGKPASSPATLVQVDARSLNIQAMPPEDAYKAMLDHDV